MEAKELLKAIASKTMQLILNMEIEEIEIEEDHPFDQESVDIVNSFAV